MDFSFTMEEDAFRQAVTDFIDAELPPELKAGGDPFSDEHFDAAMTFRRKMGAKKWIGIGWPTEYGGLGATPIMQMIFHEEMVYRQPFPGPGLAIRIIGEVTREKLEILQSADWIVMDEIKRNDLYNDLWQSFAVLTDTKSVGVQGDFRTYGYVVAIRAVTAEDAMTADWARLPYDVLARIANRIANEVPDVNRVVYDIPSKPPGTIEGE